MLNLNKLKRNINKLSRTKRITNKLKKALFSRIGRLNLISSIPRNKRFPSINNEINRTKKILKTATERLINFNESKPRRSQTLSNIRQARILAKKNNINNFKKRHSKEINEVFSGQKEEGAIILKNMTEKSEFVKELREQFLKNPNIQKIIKVDDQFFTLNDRNLELLSKLIKDGKVITVSQGIKESDTEIQQLLFTTNRLKILSLDKGEFKFNDKNEGAFFKYISSFKFKEWERYGIYSKVLAKNYKDNCFIKALKEHNILTEDELNEARLMIKNRYLSIRDITRLANKLNITIKLNKVKISKEKSKSYNQTTIHGPEKERKDGRIFNICLIEKHYFIYDKKTNVTKYALKNYKKVKDYKNWNTIQGFMKPKIKKNGDKGKIRVTRTRQRNITSAVLFKVLLDNKKTLLKEINISNGLQLTQFYDKNNEVESLGYLKSNIRPVRKPESLEELKIKNKNELEQLNYIIKGFSKLKKERITEVINKTPEEQKKIKNILNKVILENKDKIREYNSGNRKISKLTQFDKMQKIYFDFETYIHYKKVEGKANEVKEHKAYLVCAEYEKNNKIKKKSFKDAKTFLNSIKQDSLLIAHNLGYDFRFLMKHLFAINIIEKGNGIMSGNALYKSNSGKIIKLFFKDSYKLIPMKLSDFNECFNLGSTEKEIMPYKFYTNSNINREYGSINSAKKHLKNKKERMQFHGNIRKWGLVCPTNKLKFNHIGYAEKYCKLDCTILRKGYETFRRWMSEVTKLDINYFVSLPSLIHRHLINKKCYEGVYEISGVVREFIQKCLVGGRCMTRDNKKYHVKEILQDFDAVSLYPSAMVRMLGFLKGAPEILKNNVTYEELKKYDGYFVEIDVINVGKKLNFPLLTKKDDKGIRQFNNDIRGRIYVDKISLEDLIKYQKIEFKIIKGYYFNKGINPMIRTVMRELFNKRVEKKKEKNPIQIVYKLLMNSAYGKTIMKPIETNNVFFTSKKELNKFIIRNSNSIKYYCNICDVDNKYMVKMIKNINNHFSIPHVGVEILSMSKRLMNEVMCLAEDLNIKIYYQDTDSMHIQNDKINMLSHEFKKKYGRELIGGDMGQFHSDFDFEHDEGTLPVSVESYFLGKKAYIDKVMTIQENEKVYHNHIRMKGIPSDVIKNYEELNEDGNKTAIKPIEIYKRLYNEEVITFDLMKLKDKFQFNKDYSITTKYNFKRKVKFNLIKA